VLTKTEGDLIAVVGGVFAAQPVAGRRAVLGIDQVQNVDQTNASNISSGTLANARLTSNLSQIGGIAFATNEIITYNGTVLTNVSPSAYKATLSLVKGDVGLGNVANVDTTNASNISSGTLPNARLSANLSQIGNLTLSSGDYFQFNGAVITNVTSAALKTSLSLVKGDVGLGNVQNVDQTNASNITSGTLANNRLNAHLSQIATLTFATNDIITYNGTVLTNVTPSAYKATLSLVKGDVGLGNVVNLDTSTTANITDSLNKRFVTDVQSTIIGNTSGTNTGDETQATIKTKLGAATTVVDGYLTSTDWNTFNGKQPTATNLTQISGITRTNDDIIQVKAGAYTNRTMAQLKVDLVLVKADVGLGNVDNTSDANKPISTLTQTALNGKEDTITAGTTGQYYRGDKSFQTLDKTAVGLSNVANVDTTNASNISSGTLANARLSTNLTQIGNDTFANGEIIQSFGGTLQNAAMGVGVTGAVQITNTAGSILFDAPYSKGPLNQKSGFFEDFITYSSTVISPYLLRTVSGTGATTTIGAAQSSADTRNGYIIFTTGTTASGIAGCATGGLSLINFANIPVDGYEEFGARFKIPTISDGTQSFQIIAGFGDSASGLTPVDGAYITVGSGTTGFQANTSSNSTRTNSGSLLATVANTDYVVRVRVSNIGGTLSSSYYVNGTQLGTAITTNIPSGVGRDMGISFGISKLAGTTARTVELDWIYHESFKPRTINY
jgi:hypothetical protein